MEGKSGVVEAVETPVLAVENPFFENADIIYSNKDVGNIVFSKSLYTMEFKPRGPQLYVYLCITENGIVYTCFEGKEPYSKGYPTDIRITKGIVDILSFLHEKGSLIKQNGDHSTNILNTIDFVVELIKKLDFTQARGSLKPKNKKTKRKYEKKKKKKNKKKQKKN